MEVIKKNEITDAINEVIADINDILNEEREEQYLEGIILLYGLIENILKVALYYRMILDRIDRLATEKVDEDTISEIDNIREFIKNLDFYKSLRFALSIKLIDYDFFHKLDKIRENRNNIAHKLWLLKNRKDKESLRKELENLATQTSGLVSILNKSIKGVGLGMEDIGIDNFIK